MEVQLRGLMKAMEGLIKYRKELGNATNEFGDSALGLANIEVNKRVAHNLAVLGEIHRKIKELHEKQVWLSKKFPADILHLFYFF